MHNCIKINFRFIVSERGEHLLIRIGELVARSRFFAIMRSAIKLSYLKLYKQNLSFPPKNVVKFKMIKKEIFLRKTEDVT